ncbi:MAG: class I SAM-dependent methyltransferase [Chloroflexi bacterium]|nr:MAG: class I SAM-dependent methyltransferase [Chloroflexota bacterium]
MVIDRSRRSCLLCGATFTGRTFLCRACADQYRHQTVPLTVRKQFYEALDEAYPARSNTHGDWNVPVALLRELERLPPDSRILEIGAGGGFLAAALQERGFQRLVLTDLTATSLAALRARVPAALFAAADAARLPFRAGVFDAVISSDLIEHLPRPDVERHLHEVARVLAPGGSYFLKTPNRLVAEPFYRLRGLYDWHFWHPSMFSPGELRFALARHGLDMRLVAQPHLTGAQLAKLPGPRFLRTPAAHLPVGLLPAVARPHLEVVATRRTARGLP